MITEILDKLANLCEKINRLQVEKPYISDIEHSIIYQRRINSLNYNSLICKADRLAKILAHSEEFSRLI